MKNKSSGLAKQDAFLTRLYSFPMPCPACNDYHSYIEARGSSDWTKDLPAKCPKTGVALVHNVPVLGEDFFTIAPREMSREEEQEWQALDDNMDWMSDEQIKQAGIEIRKKYNK